MEAFEKKFREELYDHQEEPSRRVWTELEQKIHPKKPTKRPYKLVFWSAAASFLLVAISYIGFYKIGINPSETVVLHLPSITIEDNYAEFNKAALEQELMAKKIEIKSSKPVKSKAVSPAESGFELALLPVLVQETGDLEPMETKSLTSVTAAIDPTEVINYREKALAIPTEKSSKTVVIQRPMDLAVFASQKLFHKTDNIQLEKEIGSDGIDAYTYQFKLGPISLQGKKQINK